MKWKLKLMNIEIGKIKIFTVILVFLSIAFAELKVGDDAPTFYLRTLDNQKFYLSDKLKEKKPLVFDFFATWCEPCIKKMPILDSLSKVYQDVEFYYINVSGLTQGKTKRKEDPAIVKNLVDRIGIKSPILMDKYGLTAKKYDALTLPQLVIINSKGKIEYSHQGYNPNDTEKIAKVLTKLNDEK